MRTQDDTKEIEKSRAHIIVEIIEYIPDSLLSKTILKKSTGNVTVSSLDEGVELEEKHLSFDVYVQIIDGEAELTIDNKVVQLKLGEGIVVPAHARHHFSAKEQFKMVSTTIKSGYD